MRAEEGSRQAEATRQSRSSNISSSFSSAVPPPAASESAPVQLVKKIRNSAVEDNSVEEEADDFAESMARKINEVSTDFVQTFAFHKKLPWMSLNWLLLLLS